MPAASTWHRRRRRTTAWVVGWLLATVSLPAVEPDPGESVPPAAPSLARPLERGMTRQSVLREWGPPHRTTTAAPAPDEPAADTETWYYKAITLLPPEPGDNAPRYLRIEARLTFVDDRLTEMTNERKVIDTAR